MAVDCISKGYKELLEMMVDRDVSKTTMKEVLSTMPVCESLPQILTPEGKKEEVKRRAKAPDWNVKVDYTDDKGVTTPATSPSALIKTLGLKMSETQTICDDQKCTAMSVVDIFRIQGYVVACEDEKGLTLDCKKSVAGGKAMHVYHPALLTLKPKAAGQLSEEIRRALAIGKTWVRPEPK
jgi:hypothetical protein